MTTFQRARSEEQRAERRREILDTTAAMLTEMPVAQVSLNELSRRVGLAKSNVLRYFESREAVLLELLDAASKEWLAELAGTLPATADAASPYGRGDQVAGALTASLAARPVLCDLISAQAAVLERNVSTQVAAEYKRASIANVGVLAQLVRDQIGELSEHDAGRFAAGAIMVAGSIWTYANPSEEVLAAYEADPAVASMRVDFTTTLTEVLSILAAGLLVRSGDVA